MANESKELELRSDEAVQELEDRPSVPPAVDVFESDEEYLLHADLPGVDEKTIDVQFERGELSLVAHREGNVQGEALGTEFGPVIFKRVFRIPEQIDGQAVHAAYRNGVLELHLPKSPEVRPRKIEIQSE